MSCRVKFSMKDTEGQTLPTGWVTCEKVYLEGSFLCVEFADKDLLIPAHLLLEPVEYEPK